MNKNKKKIYYILAVETLLIALSGYFFFWPLVNSIVEKSDNIQKKIIDDEILSKRLSNLDEARYESQQMKAGEVNFDVFLPSQGEVGLLEELEKIAGATGNQVSFMIEDEAKKTATPAKGANDAEKKEIMSKLTRQNFLVLQVNLKGDWNGLVNFLHKLESMKKYVNVISVDSQKFKEIIASDAPAPASTGTPTAPTETEKINTAMTVVVYKK